LLDFQTGRCHVIGHSSLAVIYAGQEKRFPRGVSFSIDELGAWSLPNPEDWLPDEIWKRAQEIQNQEPEPLDLPDEVQDLLKLRKSARQAKDWATADILRGQRAEMGWRIEDTPQGARIIKK
jgi:hypothetical protein